VANGHAPGPIDQVLHALAPVGRVFHAALRCVCDGHLLSSQTIAVAPRQVVRGCSEPHRPSPTALWISKPCLQASSGLSLCTDYYTTNRIAEAFQSRCTAAKGAALSSPPILADPDQLVDDFGRVLIPKRPRACSDPASGIALQRAHTRGRRVVVLLPQICYNESNAG
jgi:hypothetical protein